MVTTDEAEYSQSIGNRTTLKLLQCENMLLLHDADLMDSEKVIEDIQANSPLKIGFETDDEQFKLFRSIEYHS
jgi:hypothetical protein